MRKLGVALVLLAACSGGPRLPSSAHGAPVIEVRGEVKNGPFSLGQADLEKLPRRELRGVDPKTGREAVWEGVSVAALVSERVDLPKGADTAVVRTANGAAIPLPLTVIRQHRPVLADRADGVRLPSPILAWPTLEQRGLATDPRLSGWWARDVLAFEIAQWQRTFGPALAIPDGAPDAARRGAAWYGDRCISCHGLRGAGGEHGPDLTRVVTRLRPAAFAALLEQHPGWRGTGGEPPGPEGAHEVWSFLHAVAASSAEPPGPRGALTADGGPGEPNAP
jgi:mono/diheme cytochrome c family protein